MGSSVPSLARIQAIIDYIAVRIDAVLASAGISTPVDAVSAPSAYSIAVELNALGAKGEAWRDAFQREPDEKVGASFRADFESALKYYTNHPQTLKDNVPSGDNAPHLPWCPTVALFDTTTLQSANSVEIARTWTMQDKF